MVLPHLPVGRALQDALMTDTCDIFDLSGAQVGTAVPCRIHHSRLFTATPDPNDANLRDLAEFGLTVPLGTDVDLGYTLEFNGLSVIAGEVLKHDTWATAIRIWASRPKDAVGTQTITLWRLNDTTEEWDDIGDFSVRIHFDRNLATQTPVRYSPANTAMYKGGTVIGDLNFPVTGGDRFTIGSGANTLACVVDYVLPGQPQRIEAHFQVDVSGPRL